MEYPLSGHGPPNNVRKLPPHSRSSFGSTDLLIGVFVDRSLTRYGGSLPISLTCVDHLSVSGRVRMVMVRKAGSREASRIDGLMPDAFTGPSERQEK